MLLIISLSMFAGFNVNNCYQNPYYWLLVKSRPGQKKIKMVVHTAKEIFGIFDVEGDEIIEKGFGGNQKLGK